MRLRQRARRQDSGSAERRSPLLWLRRTGSVFEGYQAIRSHRPAIRQAAAKKGDDYRWLCRCDCGNETAVAVANLRNGHTQSCGCEGRSSFDHLHYVDGTSVELIRSQTIRSNNSSGVTGVHWVKKEQRWAASIGFKGKRYHLGLFERFSDAVEARKEAEQRYFGTFLADYEAKISREALANGGAETPT